MTHYLYIVRQENIRMGINEIISGCMQEDRHCQRMLYEQHAPKMLAVCMRYTGDRQQAREVLNAGFLKVFRHINRFNPDSGSIDGWIYRIMVHTAIDVMRAACKLQTDTLSESLYIDRSETALDHMRAEEIIALIATLPPAYRTVFNLFVMEGHSHAEIASLLQISEGTSKSNLAKARMKLQTLIREQEKLPLQQYGK
jgi:RNA polymerase sigma factor (sigma-70 family)